MENTDRACERSQAGVVQSWRLGLNLNTGKLGASLHTPPNLSLAPLPAARSVPRPAGSSVAAAPIPGGAPAPGRAEPGSAAPGVRVCRGWQRRCRSPTRVTTELEPVLSSSRPRPGVQQPLGGVVSPRPGQKEPADLCSEPCLGLERCFLAIQAEPLFLSPQSNAHGQPACVALGLLSPWRNKSAAWRLLGFKPMVPGLQIFQC